VSPAESFVLGGLCVLANGFFTAAEHSLLRGLSPRIEELAAAGQKRARLALAMVGSVSSYLAACRLGIVLVTVALGWFMSPAVGAMLEPLLARLGIVDPTACGVVYFVVGYLFVCGVHMSFGEQVAKSVAVRHAEGVLLWSAYPLRGFYFAFLPMLWLVHVVSRGALKLLRVPAVSETEVAMSEEELRMVVASSHEQGVLDESERELLDNVLDFHDHTVREVMVPRTRVACLYTNHSLEENLAVIRDTMHTRYPMVENNRDTVVGMIHLKDLYFAMADSNGSPLDLMAIKREILAVPDTMAIDALLALFRSKRNHMAVAIDEFGGTSGIVTLEDLLEEIVGEIGDEFDTDDESEIVEGDGFWDVDGNLPLRDLLRLTGHRVEDDEVDTVGGLIMVRLNRIPRQGELVTDGPLTFEIVKMHAYRVGRVRVRLVDSP
jgi:CBS domain containing-hemolysin-like protein